MMGSRSPKERSGKTLSTWALLPDDTDHRGQETVQHNCMKATNVCWARCLENWGRKLAPILGSYFPNPWDVLPTILATVVRIRLQCRQVWNASGPVLSEYFLFLWLQGLAGSYRKPHAPSTSAAYIRVINVYRLHTSRWYMYMITYNIRYYITHMHITHINVYTAIHMYL